MLARLRGGQSVESISEWLASVPHPSAPSGAAAYDTTMGHDLASMAAFGDTSVAPLPGMALGIGPGSLSIPGLSGELGGNAASPWQFSSQSQAGSTRSGSHPDLMSWAATDMNAPPSRVGSWAESMQTEHLGGSGGSGGGPGSGAGGGGGGGGEGIPRYRGLEQVLSPLNEHQAMKPPSGTWTTITDDVNLVQHLLALYFCWEYPTFASLSKEHFLRDFQAGRHRYCSSILVNALLALGCRFSTQPMTRANPNDPYSSGDHFFKECQRLFYEETDHHSLTTIQALGIMSIREASCGRDSESWYYAGQSIRLAVEMGLHRIHDDDDEDELAVQSATFWGAFALDQ